MEWTHVSTPDGWVQLGWTNRGLARVCLPRLVSEGTESFRFRFESRSSVPLDWWDAAIEELHRFLKGEPVLQSRVPLDLPDQPPFWRKVWLALRKIPCGQVISYKELAIRVRSPRAVRAVGQACAANPIPLWIPCHRVVRSDGSLGGYSQGLEWKIRLLKREGISLATPSIRSNR